MSERTLSLRELNRALLARQQLLERRRAAPVPAVERLVGMQAQAPREPYVGLWSRVAGFRREALERAILRRELVRAVVMRGTIHLVSARDFGLMSAALDGSGPSWVSEESDSFARRVADGLREFARAPRTRGDVLAWLRERHGVDSDGSDGLWYALRIHARVAHAPKTGVWDAPRATTYVTVDTDEVEPDAARVELVRRYLSAFGPATRADVASWSGMRGRDIGPAVEALEPDLVRFQDERRRALLDIRGAPLPSADAPAPPRFLPKWDNALLAYAPPERVRILPEPFRKTVIRKNGDVAPTFLLDGFVAGTWSVERKTRSARLRLEPLRRLSRDERDELRAEGEALLRFVQPDAQRHEV